MSGVETGTHLGVIQLVVEAAMLVLRIAQQVAAALHDAGRYAGIEHPLHRHARLERTGPLLQLAIDLDFKSMKDFEPEGVVKQVPALNELLEIRNRLKSLQSRVSSSDEVTDFLKEILTDDDKRAALASELGLGGASEPKAPAADESPAPEGGE